VNLLDGENMFKKSLTLMLTILIAATSPAQINSVNAQTAKDNQASEKARARVEKMGVGRDSRIAVKLRDNSKVKGYISAVSADGFTVTNLKTGASQTVAYADAPEVKKSGGGLSLRTWVIIGAVAVAAVIVGVTVVKPVVCDGGAGC
jgi:hypothetical protein